MADPTPVPSTQSWLRSLVESLPAWARSVVVFALVGLFCYVVVTRRTIDAPAPVIVNVPAPAISPPPPVVFDENVVEGRPRLGDGVFARVVRKRVKASLMADGFLAVGGNAKPLTAAQADELLSLVDDDAIVTFAKSSGQVGDGKFLDRIASVIDWIVAHQDQLAAVVKFIMSLLMLFA